jgi:hypothetical protein
MPIPMHIYYEKSDDTRANKKPLLNWGEFQQKRIPRESLVDIFKNADSQLAIITGREYGIIVIDQDLGASDDDVKLLESFNTLKVSTPSGGRHFYFKYPYVDERIKSKSNVFGPDSHIDIRADGGIVMVPPSKYPNGCGYVNDIEFSKDNMLVFPDELLKKILNSNNNAPTHKLTDIINGVNSGSRNNDLTVIAGKLLKHMPPESWDEICLPILFAINNKNKPPLNENEVINIYKSISSREKTNQNQVVTADINIGEAISLESLLKTEFPEARYVVEHLFETGTINMLSAPPNKWKSWVVLLISICVGLGQKLFGFFNTEQQGVLIINEEDTGRLLQDRFKMLMESQESIPVYFYIGKQIRLEEEFINKIVEEAEKKNVGLIIFDSLRSVHRADENSSKDMQLIIEQLKRITKTGRTVIFTHHNRKRFRIGGNKEDDGEESRGSSAINAGIHGHLSCEEEKRDNSTYLIIRQPKLKADKKLEPFELRIEKNDTENTMRFIYEGEHKDKEKVLNKTMENLLNIYDTSNECLTIKNLVEMRVGGETTIRLANKLLIAQGRVVSMTRKEATKIGRKIRDQEGKHNENVFFLNREKELEYQEVQNVFDSF